MTHSPPIPAGNTSPYPLQEPPHVHAEPPRPTAQENRGSAQVDKTGLIGLGVVITLGLGATVMALWFAQRKTPTPPRKSAPKAKGKRSNPRKRAAAS